LNSEWILEQEGRKPIPDPTTDQIEDQLSKINPRNRSFFTLSHRDGSYVQTAGASLRLIVEYRRVTSEAFTHVVLGRRAGDNGEISVNYSGGAIALLRKEILSIDEAIIVFKHFLETKSVPPEYHQRDVTDNHQ
jgi:hypothetical protein